MTRPKTGWFVAALWLAAALFAGCSEPVNTTSFCTHLSEATGTQGVEYVMTADHPDRLEALVGELDELAQIAPDEVAATVESLSRLIRNYANTPRDERRAYLASQSERLDALSQQLTTYSFEECGVFLQRVLPTPAQP